MRSLLLFLLWLVSGTVVAADIEMKLKTASAIDGKALVDVELRYNGSEEIRVYAADLPWGIRSSLLLVPIVLDGSNKIIKEASVISDPGPEALAVKPGANLNGTIDVGVRFPGLTRLVDEGKTILLFWSYELQPIRSQPLPRVSGALLISKKN